MAKILPFPGGTTLPLPVAQVLDSAKICEAVLVLGWDGAGQLYAAASVGDSGELVWLLETFKHRLLSGAYA